MVGGLLGADRGPRITESQTPELMLLYGSGFAAIYLLIAALYWNAWSRRKELELNLVERALTKGYLLDAAAQAVVGLFSCALAVALPIRYAGLSGFAYFFSG